jgi:hypothetical protein
MCLIVDANVASLVFSSPPDDAFKLIWDALTQKRAAAVHGGELTKEYKRLNSIRRILLELGRQGVLRKIDDNSVNAETDHFKHLNLRSDDPHILALAKVSKVRLLCSLDQDLHRDFTNPQLLSPAGSVYQSVAHRHLIRRHCKPSRTLKKRRKKGR